MEHEISGVKALDFKDWCKIADIIKVGEHLTPQGASKILEIKSGINKGCPVLSTFEKPVIQGPFYIYNRDKTILVYHTNDLSDLTVELKISESTLIKALHQGSVYLKNFSFSNSLIPGAHEQLITIAELSMRLKKIRAFRPGLAPVLGGASS